MPNLSSVSRLFALSIIEVDEERMPEHPSDAEKVKEGERMLRYVKDSSHRIILDVIGKQASSEELAETANFK